LPEAQVASRTDVRVSSLDPHQRPKASTQTSQTTRALERRNRLAMKSAIADRSTARKSLRRLCRSPVVTLTSNIELVSSAVNNCRLVHNVASRAKNPPAIPNNVEYLLAVFGQDSIWISDVDVWPSCSLPVSPTVALRQWSVPQAFRSVAAKLGHMPASRHLSAWRTHIRSVVSDTRAKQLSKLPLTGTISSLMSPLP
jgi:hypothetical protein